MAIDNEVEELLNHLFDEDLSDDLSKKITLNTECLYEFKAFLYCKMHYDLDLNKFHNLLINIQKYSNLDAYFKIKVTKLLADEYIKNSCIKYVVFLIQKYPEELTELFVIDVIKNYSAQYHSLSNCELLQNIKKLSMNISKPLYFIMRICGTYYHNRNYIFEYRELIEQLSIKEKYDLFLVSTQDIEIFVDVDEAMGDFQFFEYMRQFIYDESEFCIMFRNYLNDYDKNYHMWDFPSANLYKLFQEYRDKIPQTLEAFLQACIRADDGHTIIYLGEFFSKKRIFNILKQLQYTTNTTFERFFNQYRDDEEIKNLIAFM